MFPHAHASQAAADTWLAAARRQRICDPLYM
jgi:hypothetical protein